MYRVLRALLFLLPAETAHHLGLFALELLGSFDGLCRRMRARVLRSVQVAPVQDAPVRVAPVRAERKPVQAELVEAPAARTSTTLPRQARDEGASPRDEGASARDERAVDLRVRLGNLELEHPIALAAGLDKNGVAINGLFALGFSAVEIGTVTPRPQPGNDKPRIFRIPEHEALINRMGFNNEGALAAALRLRSQAWRPGPVGGNIGKNKATPIEHAMDDYMLCVDEIAPHSDYVVINASSPNTPGLRQLQEPEQLAALLRAVRDRMDKVAPGKPLFLKIAPDLGPEAIDAIVDVAIACRTDGLIATNTTITRPVEHPLAKEAGGFSGRPLAPMATAVVARAYRRGAGRLPIIGVGGIFTAEDAYQKIRAGASAVQLYTGFIYGGPGTVKRILEELPHLLRRDGFSSVKDAVGVDVA